MSYAVTLESMHVSTLGMYMLRVVLTGGVVYSNWLALVMGTECVLCEVGTGYSKFSFPGMLILCRLVHVCRRFGGTTRLRNAGDSHSMWRHFPEDLGVS